MARPYTTSKLNLKMKGAQVVQLKANRGNYTRDEIKEAVQDYSNDLRKRNFNGEIMVTLDYGDKWRSGYFTEVGAPISMYTYVDSDYDEPDPNTYSTFRIYTLKKPARRGGYDKYNDCLYNTIRELAGSDLEKVLPSPAELKTHLGLKRNDKVPIDDVSKIEKLIPNYKINVRGDYIYTSTKAARYTINLLLLNEHYTIDEKEMWKVHQVANNEKVPLVYKFNKDRPSLVSIYGDARNNGEIKKGTYPIAFFRDQKRKTFTSPFCFVKIEDSKTMEETYKDFIETADILKEATDGRVNLYKSGGNLTLPALHLFNETTKRIQAEEIEQDEAIWIEKAMMGALIWAKNGYKGEGYKYDVVSEYPSILRDQRFCIPIKRGEFKKVTKETFDAKPFYEFGIYRCKISGSNNLFRRQDTNYYTHYDLTTAKELGLTIELICDDQPNFLYYAKDRRVGGSAMFREYVDYLFPLKQKGIKGAKKLLNILWGALCQKNELRILHNDDDETEIREDRTITEFCPINDTVTRIKFVKNKEYYETRFARIGPFITAAGRRKIFQIIKPHAQYVKRIHTDGFIASKKLDIKTGTNIGDLKYEGYCSDVEIVNNIKIIGSFV